MLRTTITTFTLALTLAGMPLVSSASTKTADELNALCESASEAHKSRCLGYIQGYLDGAGLTRSPSAEADKQSSADTSWTQRAIETRIGSKLRARDESSENYCLSGDNPAARIKARIRSTDEVADSYASAWIRNLATEIFPCQYDDDARPET